MKWLRLTSVFVLRNLYSRLNNLSRPIIRRTTQPAAVTCLSGWMMEAIMRGWVWKHRVNTWLNLYPSDAPAARLRLRRMRVAYSECTCFNQFHHYHYRMLEVCLFSLFTFLNYTLPLNVHLKKSFVYKEMVISENVYYLSNLNYATVNFTAKFIPYIYLYVVWHVPNVIMDFAGDVWSHGSQHIKIIITAQPW